jgi:hypothetical protein
VHQNDLDKDEKKLETLLYETKLRENKKLLLEQKRVMSEKQLENLEMIE